MMALAPRTVQNIPDCFQPGADHSLAPGFDHPRADKQVLAAKLGKAHALGISLEVAGLGANLLGHLGIGGNDGTKRNHQLFDFALVEQASLVHLHPDFLVHLVIGMQPARQFPQVLACVIQIDNLHRARKMLFGKIPDPLGPVAMTTFFSARLQPRFQAST